MPSPPNSITFAGVNLTIDPSLYDPFTFPRRGSILKALGGQTILQDFGFAIGDVVLHLEGQIYGQATVRALQTLYTQTGETYTLTDWYGNSMTVAWKPGDNSLVIKPNPGSNNSFSYVILLSLVDFPTYFNGATNPIG